MTGECPDLRDPPNPTLLVHDWFFQSQRLVQRLDFHSLPQFSHTGKPMQGLLSKLSTRG